MPTPKKSTIARTRPDIQDSTMDFDLIANESNLIAEELFPTFEVGQAGGNYGRIKLEQLLQTADSSRIAGASYNRLAFEFEEAFFHTKENGLELPVDENDANTYADYFDAEVVAADVVRHTILVNRENRVRDKTFGNSDIESTAGTDWTDWSAADPIADIHAAKLRHYQKCGFLPDTLVISGLMFLEMQNIDKILDRIAGQGAGDGIKADDVTAAMISRVVGLKLLVGGSTENVNAKGEAFDVEQIWDDDKALVCRRVPKGTRNIKAPGIGRSFHWAGDGSNIKGLQESYWDETCRSEIQRCRQQTDERCTYAEMGQLLTGLKG